MKWGIFKELQHWRALHQPTRHEELHRSSVHMAPLWGQALETQDSTGWNKPGCRLHFLSASHQVITCGTATQPALKANEG